MSAPRIAVLLSSYNGEKYIQEQVESILRQNNVQTTLYIRDDGSSDSTLKIIYQMASTYSNIIINAESNVGFVKSFFQLLSDAGDGFDYYAFADQDDFWLAEKLSAGVGALASANDFVPAMYCSRTEYVSASLKHLSYSPLYSARKIGFGNALVQNVATGCTIMLNPEARQLIIEKLPEKCLFHDWWIYLVVSAFGLVIYDDVSHIKYRQHEGNVVGASSSVTKSAISRAKRFFSFQKRTGTSLQITEFNRVFGPKLTPTQAAFVNRLLSARKGVWNRISLLFENFYWRQNIIDNFLVRFMILIGRF